MGRMRLIPSMAVLGGAAVSRTLEADGTPTPITDDPIALLQRWVEQGVRILDLADLDGAYRTTGGVEDLIARVTGSRGVVLQYGGGIRTVQHARDALEMGVNRICIQTLALHDPETTQDILSRWPDRTVVALDLEGDRIDGCSWAKRGATAADVVRQLRAWGAARFLVWDLDRPRSNRADGNVNLRRLAEETGVRVSVGTNDATNDELSTLRELESAGVDEVLLRIDAESARRDLGDLVSILES
jgi:phosphoribosylformimino-5-aminoimidazole carboxamide ribotide isomerase